MASGCQPADLKCNRPQPLYTLKEARQRKKEKQIIYKVRKEIKVKLCLLSNKPDLPKPLVASSPVSQNHKDPLNRLWTARKITKEDFQIAIEVLKQTDSWKRYKEPEDIWKGFDMKDKSFLDIGCGGLGLDCFYNYFFNGASLCIGIDTQPRAIQCCNDQLYRIEYLSKLCGRRGAFVREWMRFPEGRKAPINNIRFYNTESYEFDDESFDVVNLSWVVNFEGIIPEELKKEAFRICRTGGTVVISDARADLWLKKRPEIKTLEEILFKFFSDTDGGFSSRYEDFMLFEPEAIAEIKRSIDKTIEDMPPAEQEIAKKFVRELYKNWKLK